MSQSGVTVVGVWASSRDQRSLCIRASYPIIPLQVDGKEMILCSESKTREKGRGRGFGGSVFTPPLLFLLRFLSFPFLRAIKHPSLFPPLSCPSGRSVIIRVDNLTINLQAVDTLDSFYLAARQ